jgi:hypothetical protein
MTLAILFWILMLLWLFLGFYLNHDSAQPFYRWGSGHLLLWILLAVLGWGVFGAPVSNSTTPTYQQQRAR